MANMLGAQSLESDSPGFSASAPPPASCVTLGKSANLSGHVSSSEKMGTILGPPK